jgi:DNA-binding NarL/FixJ family response regulator
VPSGKRSHSLSRRQERLFAPQTPAASGPAESRPRPDGDDRTRSSQLRVLIVVGPKGHSDLESSLEQNAFDVSVTSITEDPVEESRTLKPDVVVLEFDDVGAESLAVGEAIFHLQPATKLVLVTDHEDPTLVHGAISKGFTGYVLKGWTPRAVAQALRSVAESQTVLPPRSARELLGIGVHERVRTGWKQLTKREREILDLLASGLSSRSIARRLFLSENTVRTHIQNVLAKLRVHSRVEAVAYALRHTTIQRLHRIEEAG